MRALPFLLLLALLPSSSAGHCVGYTTSTNTWADTDPLGAGVGPQHYVVFDNMGCPTCMTFYSLWVYEESNGIDGLQRGDEVVDDTCHGMIQPDTIVV